MSMRITSFYLLLTALFLVCCSKRDEDPKKDIWTQKAKFPGKYLEGAVSFVIDSKLFVGTGLEDDFVNYFYVYNNEDDSWKAVASLASSPRAEAISFSIGKYGYVGLGISCAGLGICTYNYYNDLWRYNPEDNSWKKMTDFPGSPRASATCFVINDKAYITGGSSYDDNDLWEYNPSTDTWTKKASYPGACISRTISFSLNGSHCFKYDPLCVL